MSSKIKYVLLTAAIVLGVSSYSYAAEINAPGFTGTANTTLTTGISVRIDRDCITERGTRTMSNDPYYQAWVTNNVAKADQAAFRNDGAGCAKRRTDGYGNAGNNPRQLTSENADDGNMNFGGGDVFDATTRVFTEITGSTDSGVGVNLSFVGSHNAVNDIASPNFAPFTNSQLDDIETNIDILNAYVTTDIDDLSITAGRFVTNWGESTFIPVGMNGLTTNALDLDALRKPGASIKEALVPTEQVTIAGYLDNGWSYEAYYQLNDSHLELPESGTFFGNEIVSGNRLSVTGGYANPVYGDAQARACGYLITAAVGGCNATALALFETEAGKQATAMYRYQEGLDGMFTGENSTAVLAKAALIAAGAAASFGGTAGDIETLGATNPAAVKAAYDDWDEYTKKGGVKTATVDAVSNGHLYADGKDQFGLSLRTYLDDVGTGVDLGIYFAQYDSKVPYFRFKGQQGVTAGDLFGAFQLAAATGATFATYMSAAVGGVGAELNLHEGAAKTQIIQGLGDVAYGEGACGAYQNPKAANSMYQLGASSNFLYTSEQKSNALNINYTNFGGNLYHDSIKCATNAGAGVYNTGATQGAAAALLGAAVTPLNMAEYEWIYPENLQVIGLSANTNVNGTTVQAELAYRPNFPLATAITDQGAQLSDAVGTTTLLSMGVAQGIYASDPTFAMSLAQYQANVSGAGSATAADMLTAIKSFNRSYLPRISLATIAAGDFYTTPYIEYDTWSGTVGTTTSFTASHPVTAGLGADSSVVLTEVGVVHIMDLPTDTGFVNRGGYRDGVGGVKCGGVTQAGTTFNAVKAYDGLTHLASGQTDPLFGNGSYCESQNGADQTSWTYRLIGSATYSNLYNSPWNFSPSFVWSHDFSGYGPTSLGGFVPGRQSLSLSGNFSKGDMSAGISYVNQLGDEEVNPNFDDDYLSANVSYAF